MRVFLSWSGELSMQVAQILKKWIPCIIQSVEVFFSPNDIEKGENWDSKISGELADCNYGIVCLTTENTNAPWIHFEAGALAKTFDSRVTALMININTSDIKGPLSRFQATKLEKSDFNQLIVAINSATTKPLQPDVLKTAFDAIWDNMLKEINEVIARYPTKTPQRQKISEISNSTLEEILQLVRKQDVIISSPDKLLPKEYFEYLKRSNVFIEYRREDEFIERYFKELYHYFMKMLNGIENSYEAIDFSTLKAMNFEEFFQMYFHYGKPFSSNDARISFNRVYKRYTTIMQKVSQLEMGQELEIGQKLNEL